METARIPIGVTMIQTRLPFAFLTLCFFLVTAGRSAAEDAPPTDLKPLLEKVKGVVEKHYPKATVALKDQAIHFEFNIRTFMIHNASLLGEWGEAHEESGPQKGGIFGDIELRAGSYGGMLVSPQAFDMRYFTLLLTTPYSKKLNQHLFIHLKYPRDASKEFLKDFELVVGDFEKYVSVKGK